MFVKFKKLLAIKNRKKNKTKAENPCSNVIYNN